MRKYLLVLLLLPACVRAEGLYQIHPLSEPELLQTYTLLLRDACHHAEQDWTNSSFDPAAGYWGDGVSAGNAGIRTIAGMVLSCGTLLKYDSSLDDAERKNLSAKAIAAIRYVTATHVTGTNNCSDGKHWGATDKHGPESWQSGMWMGTFAFGTWLMWDRLDPELRESVQRVVAWEDDELVKIKPPTGLWGDTKAEENGWEVPCLALGELMMPANPHVAQWHQTTLDYMMNTLCTTADSHDTNIVDGRAVKQWVRGPNLQLDFTLENHNIFHPSYVGCSSYFLNQTAMYYVFAGRPVPQACTNHVLDVWKMFQTIMLPWGESAYPQGMDWELHGTPYLNLFATLATHDHDQLAARMEQNFLQYMRAWQTMFHGDLALPGSPFGIARHSICAEQACFGFLAHKIFGPAAEELSADAAAAQQSGAWNRQYVDFVTHRTAQKLVCFSWKNRVMGQIIPIGAGHEDNPMFTTPITNGFVGSFELTPHVDGKTTVIDHSSQETPAGQETTGILLLDGGRLKQELTVTSVGNQTVVYQDRVTALSDVAVKAELGAPAGIENDDVNGGKRVVSYQDGEILFDFKKPQPPAALAGKWANVDGRLGVVMVAGAGLTYAQAAKYSPGITVYADTLYASYSDKPKQFKEGEEVARRVVVYFVEVTPKETASLAQTCRIEEKDGGQVLRFRQAGGGDVEVPLMR